MWKKTYYLISFLFLCLWLPLGWYNWPITFSLFLTFFLIFITKEIFFVITIFAGIIIIIYSSSLLAIWLAIETISLITIIMITKSKNIHAFEASIKYIIISAISSALYLLGMLTLDYIGLLFINLAILIKLGVSPFHLWVADIYEGTSIKVLPILALLPKIGYLVLILKLINDNINILLIIIGLISIIIGAVGALNQLSIKRLLAYSGISNMGFLIIGVVFYSSNSLALPIYFIIYIINSLIIFTIVINLKDNLYINDLSQLGINNPYLALLLSSAILSLAGVPPFLGFWGKLVIIYNCFYSGWVFLAISLLFFAVIATFYYIRLANILFNNKLLINSIIIIKHHFYILIILSFCFIGCLITSLKCLS